MPLSKDYRFKSERLCFRGIEEGDACAIVRWRSNPDNYRYFFNSRPITMEEHCAWFKKYQKDPTRYDFIIEDSNGNAIGTCGLSRITGEGCEVSYMIGEVDARGKGYATEAIRAITDIAFSELGVSHIDARVLAHNDNSSKAALRSGFVEYERVFRIENRY